MNFPVYVMDKPFPGVVYACSTCSKGREFVEMVYNMNFPIYVLDKPFPGVAYACSTCSKGGEFVKMVYSWRLVELERFLNSQEVSKWSC